MGAFQVRLAFQKRRENKEKKQEKCGQLASRKLLIQFEEVFLHICMFACCMWVFVYFRRIFFY